MNIFDLITRLWSNHQAVPSFNFTTADVALTAAKKVKEKKHYCLLSTSERELTFQTMEVVTGIVRGLKNQGYPVLLNLDHGKSIDIIAKAISSGYDCIHFDGSHLPLEENIKQTKEIINQAKEKHISVEGEVGVIGGASKISDETMGKSILTDPEEAIRYVKETNVNLLACSFGSYHGLSNLDKKLNVKILDEISSQTRIPFVLHGGSGIAKDEIARALQHGVIKINFNTELRLAWSNGIKDYQKNNPQDIIPVNILEYADSIVAKVLEEKINLCLNTN